MSNYINGRWQKGSGDEFHSINPANNEIIWRGNIATEEDSTKAFESASNARGSWQSLSFESRASYIQNFVKSIRTHQEELTEIIAKESGKPIWESATEVNAVIGKIDISIKAYKERCAITKSTTNGITSAIHYKPHGTIAIIGPFNFPAHLSNGHIVPALLAGNTVIYKPSELTPSVAELITKCWHESKIPAGVFNCLQGDGITASTLIAQDIQGVFFTGSSQTGLKINELLSDRPNVILALEMGGNNPLVIDEVNNTDESIKQAIFSTMITAGQRCSCARRLIIPNNPIGDKWLEKFADECKKINIGPYTQAPEPYMGPVIREKHAIQHLKKQHELINNGGEYILEMRQIKSGLPFLSPGIIDMTNANKVLDQEIFAPLVQVHRYDNFEQAVKISNQTKYGLVAGLFSNDKSKYDYFFKNVKAGLINWNRPTTGASSSLPFGGIGNSGNNRPSAFFATDYCSYPIASLEQSIL